MMMGLSGAAASDFDKALALLQAFANPAGVTAHIELVRAEEAKAAERIKDANDRGAILDREREAFEADKANTIANLDRREGELDAREKDLDVQAEDLKRRNDAMIMADAANKADRKKLDEDRKVFEDARKSVEADLTERGDLLNAIEADLGKRLEAADAREAALAEKEAAYEERLKALNAALKPVRG